MNALSRLRQALPRIFAALILPLLVFEGIRLAAGASFSPAGLLLRGLAVLAILIIARLSQPNLPDRRVWVWPWAGCALALTGIAAALIYVYTQSTTAALALVLIFIGLSLAAETALAAILPPILKWVLPGLFAVTVGGIVAAAGQVESRFAEEEFFVALQALALALGWLGLHLALGWLPAPQSIFSSEAVHSTLPGAGGAAGIRVRTLWAALLPIFVIAGLLFTARSYQDSFYPTQAPGYPIVTRESPFMCGQASPDPVNYDSQEVFQKLLALVQANPYKAAPEYGLLALATGDTGQAEAFKSHLLEEARAGLFTAPAHSVKYIQYQASFRVYYYTQIRRAFPDLFTQEEEERIHQWLAEVNRRAMTVEWVDWLYGLAFSKWPEGPYENQETGAALLALLEAENLGAPELSAENRAYLDRNRRGWSERFRVTDDAVVYQPEFINNAFFQSLDAGIRDLDNLRRSFEWLYAQALPDGAPVQYNHPASVSLADLGYLAATFLEDGRYLWLAGRAADYLAAHDGYLGARPGMEAPVDLAAEPATTGSCLLYGDSGLPNQAGPLAPDKIVFRNGWDEDSIYLLLNLRFTGWHRYKATNTLTLLYQSGALVSDQLSGSTFAWLPTGRSLFRDKRIPRENLNGLVVERTGLSAVLYALTGIGGPWAQDPPYYAQVIEFNPGYPVDSSRTRIQGWRGWDHTRSVYFHHDGLVAVYDEASGPPSREAGLIWHIRSQSPGPEPNRFTLRSGEDPVEMVLIPVASAGIQIGQEDPEGTTSRSIQVGSDRGELKLLTVFLFQEWAGAQVQLDSNGLSVDNGDEQIRLAVPAAPEPPLWQAR